MKIRTFVIGYVLALALLVFANHRTDASPASSLRAVIDLTSTSTDAQVRPVTFRLNQEANTGKATQILAPAVYSSKLWSVDQIPAERLIAPLAVIHVNGTSPVSMEDVASYEHNYGQIPLGSVVLVRLQNDSATPAFSSDAVRFLVHARNVIGLGVSAEDGRNSDSDAYALSHSTYLLKNLANVDKVPAVGCTVMVAPSKLGGAKAGPVRVLALVR